jgi:hypothetical protein
MSEAMTRYRQLERRLWVIRWRHEGEESTGEDSVLDEMDGAWAALTDEERTLLDREGPRCWPMEARGWVPTAADAACLITPEQPTYAGFASVAETIEE